MSELIIIAFSSEAAAIKARDLLVSLQLTAKTSPEDIILVIRKRAGEIRLEQSVWRATGKPLGDGRWGMLIGSLFLDERDAKKQKDQGLAAFFRKAGLETRFLNDVSTALVSGGAAVGMRLQALTAEAVIDTLSKLAEPGRVLRAKLTAEVASELEVIHDFIPEYVPAHLRPLV